MARPKQSASPTRLRVGRVSVYQHHGNWWIYYRESGSPVRRKVSASREEAEQVAAQTNAQLTSQAPTASAFRPITVVELRTGFLDYHEQVLASSHATVRRYRAATQHLEDFVSKQTRPAKAHEVQTEQFVAYLRNMR